VSDAGKPSPRLPLDADPSPHPDGLRIALGAGGIFYLYPPAPRTQVEADAAAVWIRVLVATAVAAAANTVAEAVETEAGAQTIDEWVAAEAAAMAAPLAAAGADALRAALEPPALSESEEACVQAVRAYLQGFAEAAALEGVAAMRAAEDEEAAGGERRAAALQLAGMAHAIGLPLEVARAPVFAAGGSPRGNVQLSLITVGSLHYQPFNVLEPKGPMTVRDALLLAHITRRYVVAGCPADRWVHLSLNEAARLAGYRGSGVIPRNYVRAAHARMRSTTYQGTVRDADGSLHSLTWGVIDLARTFEPKAAGEEGRASVKLNEAFANLVKGGALAYLDEATFARLVRRDELAARLWVFLEAETLPKPRSYSLFSAPDGEPERERDTPAIADQLRMRGWKARRRIAARVKDAAAAIVDEDSAYSLVVEHAKQATMWNLTAARKPRRLTAGEVSTPGRAPGVPPVAPPVDNCSATSDGGGTTRDGGGYNAGRKGGTTRDATGTLTVSSLPSVSTVSQILRDTGFQENPVRDPEQPIDHDESAEGQETEKRLEAKACPAADIVDHMFGTPDRLADFVSLIGGDERILDALALTVCRQFRNASGGAVCRDAAEHDGAGNVAWCPAFDAAHGVALKIANYLSKRGQVKGSPAAYVLGCIKRAAGDPADLMGRTREESKAAYRSMCSLHPRGSTAAAFGYTPKGIDD